MNLILFGAKTDKQEFCRFISSSPEWCYRNVHISDYADYDAFIAELAVNLPDGIIIAVDGADGMEGVIAARNVCRGVPILWFSDDGGFGAQSYRLGCAYFHKKPISPQVLSAAIAKCV